MAGWNRYWSGSSTPCWARQREVWSERYIEKMTGLSRAQGTRLIALYTASGRVQETNLQAALRSPAIHTGRRRVVDEAHDALSGPATRRILEREHTVYTAPARYVVMAIIGDFLTVLSGQGHLGNRKSASVI